MLDIKETVKCPNCKQPITITLRERIPGRRKACPGGCGFTIQFTGDDGRKMQRSIDSLTKTLRNMGVRVRIK